jgi:hypothetical protein
MARSPFGLRSLLARWVRQPVRRRNKAAETFQPWLEVLEDRVTPNGTFMVTDGTDGAGDPNSLRGAINAANGSPGGLNTIKFAAAVTTVTLTQATQLQLGPAAPLVIQGPGSGSLTITETTNNPRIFMVAANAVVTMNGLTMQAAGGVTCNQGGCGILNNGNLTLNDVVIQNLTGVSVNGGGIYNQSTASGAAIITGTSVKILGNTLTNGSGAGIINTTPGGTAAAQITLTSSSISNNTITVGGGQGAAVYNGNGNAGSLTLNNSIVSGNLLTGTATGVIVGIRNCAGTTLNATSTQFYGNQNQTTNYGWGGAIGNYGAATFTNCAIGKAGSPNISHGVGAGVRTLAASTLTMTGGSLSYNSTTLATGGNGGQMRGGGMFIDGQTTVTITNVTIQGNSAQYGAGLSSNGNLTISGCTIGGTTAAQRNTAISLDPNRHVRGGGLRVENGIATISNCTFENNSANMSSGNNVSAWGGGLSLEGGVATLSGCLVVGNSTTSNNGTANSQQSYGGGIAAQISTTITNSIISGNTVTGTAVVNVPVRGGGIWANNYLKLSNDFIGVTVKDSAGNSFGGNMVNAPYGNTNSPGGGGIWFQGSQSTWNSIVVVNNVVTNGQNHQGGGIRFNTGNPETINNSIIANNLCGAQGGGILSGAFLTINNTTISGNTSGGTTPYNAINNNNSDGGGLWSQNALYMNNSTVANNKMNGNGQQEYGTGVYVNDNLAKIVNCTITGNGAGGSITSGFGGIGRRGGILTLINSLVTGNAGGANPDIANSVNGPNSVNNLIGFGNSGLVNGVNGNKTGVSGAAAMLGSLQNNGGATIAVTVPSGTFTYGPVQTIALLTGSPAIDAGNNSFSPGSFDERGTGFNRIINGTIDIGAYEFQPPTTTTTVAVSPTTVTVGQSVTITTTVAGSAPGSSPPQGTVTFLVNGAAVGTGTLANGTATFTTSSLPVGSDSITVQYPGFTQGSLTFNASTGSTSITVNPTVPPPTPPTPPTPPQLTGFYAVGTDAGTLTQVNVYNAVTGALTAELLPFGAAFTGGARVAMGDINGDGVADIIVGAGPGGLPQVTIFDGRTFQPIFSFFAFSLSSANGIANFPKANAIGNRFVGGVFVAAGNLSGSGYNDIIVGADTGGGPQVQVFDGKSGALLSNFFAFAPTFTGGVRVAAGDVFGIGRADIIASAGPGAGPQVNVYDGHSFAIAASFYAMFPLFTGGTYVAAGVLNGTGPADLIVGAGASGGPQVTVFAGGSFNALSNFYAYPSTFTGGVRVGFTDVNGTGELLTAPGRGGGPQVSLFSAASLSILDSFFAISAGTNVGLFVGGI